LIFIVVSAGIALSAAIVSDTEGTALFVVRVSTAAAISDPACIVVTPGASAHSPSARAQCTVLPVGVATPVGRSEKDTQWHVVTGITVVIIHTHEVSGPGLRPDDANL
jgi:hypothetical protein